MIINVVTPTTKYIFYNVTILFNLKKNEIKQLHSLMCEINKLSCIMSIGYIIIHVAYKYQ